MPHLKNRRRPLPPEFTPEDGDVPPMMQVPQPAMAPMAPQPPQMPQGMMPGMSPGMAPPPAPPGPPGMPPGAPGPQGGPPPGQPNAMPPGGGPEAPEPEAEGAVDPKVLQALVDRGLLDEETAVALLDRKQGAEMAFGTPSPQGVNTPGPFGTYVAASPLEHAAAGMQRYLGGRQMKQGTEKQGALQRRKKMYDTDVMDWVLK